MDEFIKPLFWVGSSKRDLKTMPEDVQDVFGYALHLAQNGEKHAQSKPLKGFNGAGVLEVMEDYMGNAYRAVYTVTVGDAVYVLHCFQKKSARGIKTPKPDRELIHARLSAAQAHAAGGTQ
ncbi:MAG: type II toxin-antitoxin system RelE/ParE family toxin [Gammaproteobacteria bacterium]|nr:type II toxin-antitoxin system RelE/ParE family toxin [Gammaproteobacteria bacterium]